MSYKYFTVNIRAYLDKDDDAEDASLVGYFSLTVKPISVQASNISKTMAKKLSRVSILDEETQSYTTAAYLIAQLGKNTRFISF